MGGGGRGGLGSLGFESLSLVMEQGAHGAEAVVVGGECRPQGRIEKEKNSRGL